MTNNLEGLIAKFFDKNLFWQSSGKDDKWVVAVSGGSDSLSLLFLLYDFLKDKGMAHNLHAVTVDHRLREESVDEAEYVANICKLYNIKHKIISWHTDKPKTSLPMHARYARYNILAQYMKEINANKLWVGHTLDDQIETIYMRQTRGGGRGQAGMSTFSLLFEEILLLRPLLEVRRIDLRNYLNLKNISWIDDPTNDNLNYERPRVRCYLKENPDLLTIDNINEYAEKRVKTNIETAELLSLAPLTWINGALTFPMYWARQNYKNKSFSFLLNILTCIVGGRNYLLSNSEQITYCDRLLSLKHNSSFTIARALISNREGMVYINRENRHFKEIEIEPYAQKMWDGRFLIKNLGNETIVAKSDIQSYGSLAIFNCKGERLFLVHSAEKLREDIIEVDYIAAPFYFLVSGYDIKLYKDLLVLLGKDCNSTII